MSVLQIAVEPQRDGITKLALSGIIAEDADLESIFAGLSGDIALNLRDIERINSMGVRRWIPALAAASASRKIWLDDLSYPMVIQANCIFDLLSHAVVRSCMAPYYCAPCNRQEMSSVAAAEIRAKGTAPARTCSQCGGPLEFDELDGYFNFLRR
jgi:hypothetical protein